MKHVKWLFVASALSLVALSAAADDNWVPVGVNAIGDVIEVNAASIKGDRQKVTFWARTKHKSPKSETVGKTTKKVASTLFRYQIGCTAETITSLGWVTYEANGALIDSATNEYPKPGPIVPDSVGETLMKSVCGALTDDPYK